MHPRFLTGLFLAGLLLAPSAALAATGTREGGVGLGGAPIVQTQAANLIVSASDNGITVTTHESALEHQTVQFTGTAPIADAGAVVEIERIGMGTLAQWVPTVQATVSAGGAFAVSWRAEQSGVFSVRAVRSSGSAPSLGASGASGVAAPALATASKSTSGSATTGSAPSTLSLTVYHPAVASYYGGPLLGRMTACGVKLTRTTLGVASVTVKCGTDVRIYYGGRTIVVPVIDRGPYVSGRSWDLTVATARALGMLRIGVATIGTVALPVRQGATSASPTSGTLSTGHSRDRLRGRGPRRFGPLSQRLVHP